MEDSHPHTYTQEQAPRLIAFADLSVPASDQHRVLLTEQSLQIHYKSRSRAFSLAYIDRLALEHRKLWLPLIGGGILSCLCLLALMHTFNMPFRLMGGAAIGAFGMWWGIRGSMALVIYEQRHHTDFLINHVSKSLPVFLAFANRLIRRYPNGLGDYCFTISLEEYDQLQQQGQITIDESRPCLPIDLVRGADRGQHLLWLAFDPLQMGARIQWVLQEHELTAFLHGVFSVQELKLHTC